MIRTAIVVVAVLMLSAATTLSYQETSVGTGLDLDVSGNTGNALGTIDTCRSVDAGTTFDIDVFVRGAPPFANGDGGVAAFGFNLHFDPAVVRVTAVENGLMLGGTSKFEIIDADYNTTDVPDPLPSTSGNLRVDFADLSANYESGDGTLSRLTLEVVGAGVTDLTLDSQIEGLAAPIIVTGASQQYTVSDLQNARLSVGQPCEAPPGSTDPPDTTLAPGEEPTPTGTTAGGSPTTAPSQAPAGDAELAVDVVTDGNEATSLGDIDTCAAADLDDTFEVDIVIKGVTDLLAWEAPVSYDPAVLRVDDRDVRFFQDANEGSSVHDSSALTPDISGTYLASAADIADPARPDSGEGVLVRLIMTAVGEGTSDITLEPIDLNDDGVSDRGILLKNVDNAIIGSTDSDTFFDGPAGGAEVRVGETCADGGRVVIGEVSDDGDDEPGEPGGDDDGSMWIIIAAVAAAVAVAGGAALFFMRNRSAGAP